MNQSQLKNVSRVFSNINWFSLVKLIFWILFIIALITFTTIFIHEKSTVNQQIVANGGAFDGRTIGWIKDNINNGSLVGTDLTQAYLAMYQTAKFPCIDFSLMLFITNSIGTPATDPMTAWTTRSNAVDLSYSYMFITTLIALVALTMQLYTNALMIYEDRKVKKYQLSTKFPTSTIHFRLFRTQMYVDFVTNLAIVFAFFNFLSTLIVIGYWLFIYAINLFLIKVAKAKGTVENTFGQHRSDIMYLIFVMVFQNVYTIIKALFLSKWGVNLDLIFSIILPIGTITVIVGLFIKNMLNSKVNSVLNGIKGIEGSISTFRTFYYTNKIEAIQDFNFVNILPPMLKKALISGNLSKDEINGLLIELDNAIKFIETHYGKNVKEKRFLLYVLLNNVTNVEQIREMQANTIKLENV